MRHYRTAQWDELKQKREQQKKHTAENKREQQQKVNKPEKRQPDFTLMIITVMLLGLGVVMVYSASQIVAYTDFGDSAFYFKRQLIFAAIGLLMMVITMNIPYPVYKKWVPVILFVLFIIMVLVTTPLGVERGGAQRWLNLGFIVLQPSEFVKLGLILYLALLYSKKQHYIDHFMRGVVPPLVVVGLFFGLILVQRDLGTAMSVILFTMVILFCSGARFKHMFALGFTTVMMFAVFALTQQYRMNRLTSFMDPWSDPGGSGYQIIQSLYAIGNGGIIGSGFGNSVQKYLYLPEAHTDFIFSIIAEELGLIGVVVILLLFVVFTLRGLKVANEAPDSFGMLLGIGIVSMIATQTMVNLGVASGMLPVTGLTLPFFSYGGSSLLLTMTAVGILLNISRYRRAEATDATESERAV
jgi:cell division protein FtsW